MQGAEVFATIVQVPQTTYLCAAGPGVATDAKSNEITAICLTDTLIKCGGHDEPRPPKGTPPGGVPILDTPNRIKKQLPRCNRMALVCEYRRTGASGGGLVGGGISGGAFLGGAFLGGAFLGGHFWGG